MKSRRTERINSLLQEVISEVIHREIKNPHLPDFISITRVETSKDLQHAKVFISVIGAKENRDQALSILQSSSGFIARQASKKIILRYFPALNFVWDDTLDKQMHIHNILENINEERASRVENEQ